jgi:hypothetical protein
VYGVAVLAFLALERAASGVAAGAGTEPSAEVVGA